MRIRPDPDLDPDPDPYPCLKKSLPFTHRLFTQKVINGVLYRKLPLKDAKAILRKNGVPEEEIKKLSR